MYFEKVIVVNDQTQHIVDSDGDGIANINDDCPYVYGEVWNSGCPANEDTDKDGVLNKDDACPKVYGAKENHGCPMLDKKEVTIKKTRSFDSKKVEGKELAFRDFSIHNPNDTLKESLIFDKDSSSTILMIKNQIFEMYLDKEANLNEVLYKKLVNSDKITFTEFEEKYGISAYNSNYTIPYAKISIVIAVVYLSVLCIRLLTNSLKSIRIK